MINLLPPDVKKAYRYGQRNLELRKWLIFCGLALIGLGLISTYGLLTFSASTTNFNHQIASSNALLKKDNLTQTEKQTTDISNSLRLAVKVLGKEVLFSKLITQIGAVMPSGAVLSGLDINTALNGVDLTADTTDYAAATQIQVNLTSPSNKIFAKVDIVSIVCEANNPPYPCTAQFSAEFNPVNQFLFINQGAKT
jgi:hypothetical protein